MLRDFNMRGNGNIPFTELADFVVYESIDCGIQTISKLRASFIFLIEIIKVFCHILFLTLLQQYFHGKDMICNIVAHVSDAFLLLRERGVRFILGTRNIGLGYDETVDQYGLDWPRLCAEGEVDGVVFPRIDFRKGQEGVDPWEATDRVYAKVAAQCGKADVYFSVNAYPGTIKNGFGSYAEQTGLSKGECAKRLLGLAKKRGAKGVVLVVVDYNNYPDDVCKAIREFE